MHKIKGIGLVELMLVLSIIAIILVLAARYYQTANLSRQVNEAYKHLEAIGSAAQSWWDDNNHDFTKLTNGLQDLIDQGYLTSDYKQNIWGTGVTVTGKEASLMEITFSDIPTAGCNSLLTKLGIDEECTANAENESNLAICVNASKQFKACAGEQ